MMENVICYVFSALLLCAMVSLICVVIVGAVWLIKAMLEDM